MTRDADGIGGKQTPSLAVKCPRRTSAAPRDAAAAAPGLLVDLGPCQPLQRPRPAGSLGALPTGGGGGVGASSAGRVGLCLRGSLGTGGPGSRERGRGGRRKWGRGGHSGLAAEDSSSERRDPDLRGGRKVPAPIPPRSARARLRAPRSTCGTPPGAQRLRAHAPAPAHAHLMLSDSRAAPTQRPRARAGCPLLRTSITLAAVTRTLLQKVRGGEARVGCRPASQVHCGRRPPALGFPLLA